MADTYIGTYSDPWWLAIVASMVMCTWVIPAIAKAYAILFALWTRLFPLAASKFWANLTIIELWLKR